ncbi:hypothetical protein [Pseudomonas syringae group sp. J309-1]|nr:hypothetical protein [Pseudomonas syringae group sp. J309-1]MDU8357645.1 hypothetical protein [Pseudomonas syringae group sp. J309-1]
MATIDTPGGSDSVALKVLPNTRLAEVAQRLVLARLICRGDDLDTLH